MNIIRRRAYCRAGLIGNPSDGYNGRTISFTMENFYAEVVLYPWDELEIVWTDQDKHRFASLDALVEDVNLNGYYGGIRLVKAAIKRFAEFCRNQPEPEYTLHDGTFSIRYETNIPRGVGLAGSSAIVVATLKCLAEFYGIDIAKRVQASLARSVENEDLGIVCGFQDRVAQVYGGLVAMDFSEMKEERGYQCGQYERLEPSLLPPIYLAYFLGSSKTSDAVHSALRTRVQDNQSLTATMNEIADLVPVAKDVIVGQHFRRLHELINKNFDLRTKLYDIRQSDWEMIQMARRVGASAKFAGSGGAIVGTYEDESAFMDLRESMKLINHDWKLIKPIIA